MAFIVINIIILLVAIGLIVLIGRGRITLREAGLKMGVMSFIVIVGFIALYSTNTRDSGIINGQVSSKDQVRVSCSHSYDCRCYQSCSGTGTNRSCRRVCSTCYEHSNDWDWRVKTTINEFNVSRVDRRGSTEPPRWTAVKIGEPVSASFSYTNYIFASPSSLFSMGDIADDKRKFGKFFPSYPTVFDYYRINRVIQSGTVYQSSKELNEHLSSTLRTLGPNKNVNIVVQFVGTTDKTYRYALERAWLGSKVNDVVVVIGQDASGKFAWADSFAFGKSMGNELLLVQLRDGITALGNSDAYQNPGLLAAAITGPVTDSFKRKSMEDFAYLKNEYRPSGNAIVVLAVLQTIALLALSIWMYREDTFGEGTDKRLNGISNPRRFGSNPPPTYRRPPPPPSPPPVN